MYNIIMFNMSPASDWQNGIVNRNFFVLGELAQRPEINKIMSVDLLPMRGPAPFGLKRVIKYIIESLLPKTDLEIIQKNLTSRCFKKDNIYYYSAVDLYLNKKYFFKNFKNLLGQLDFYKSDCRTIVWSYNPLWLDYYDELESDLKIFDTVDNWSVHASYQNYYDQLRENYKIIDQKADLILTVAEELRELYQNKSKVHWIPNGVEIAHFRNSPAKTDNQQKIIGYIGTIQNRFDVDLAKYLAKNNPDKKFVIGGPVWMESLSEIENKLKPLNNVYL
ncbi:MAG TPA: hypothetical protein VGA49_01450, partial [Patescibacteria group bacterium]